jgi:hypothetical protein
VCLRSCGKWPWLQRRERRSRERCPVCLGALLPVFRLSQKMHTMSAREGWWCPRCGSLIVLGSNRTSCFDRCGFETYRIVCKRCETLLIDPADDAPLISEFESAVSQPSARLWIKKNNGRGVRPPVTFPVLLSSLGAKSFQSDDASPDSGFDIQNLIRPWRSSRPVVSWPCDL